MENINKIIRHPLFLMSIEKIKLLEKGRIFCCHGIDHGLDVARMAWIVVLERGLPISKEEVYAAGLLHDIGRWRQYEDDVPHDLASAEIAQEILSDTGFEIRQKENIIAAILGHRNKDRLALDTHGDRAEPTKLSEIICELDKKSRICMFCAAKSECYWPDNKKNSSIEL